MGKMSRNVERITYNVRIHCLVPVTKICLAIWFPYVKKDYTRLSLHEIIRRLVNLLKRDSNTSIFLQNPWNFSEQLFRGKRKVAVSAKIWWTSFFIEHLRRLLLQKFNESLNEAFIICFESLKSSLKNLKPASHKVLYPFNVKRRKIVRPRD